MNDTFSTLSPKWNIPGVKVYTILSRDTDSNAVTFSHYNALGSICREKLEQLIKPVHPISWLQQVHGNYVVELPVRGDTVLECMNASSGKIVADGAFTLQKRVVCTVLTADCLPIVFANRAGTKVGVVHAGRKGLQNGIISEMIKKIKIPADETYIWIGPGIAAESYPISKEIKKEVLFLSPTYESVFTEYDGEQHLMDLYKVARIQLTNQGIPNENIDGAVWNTFTDKRFHSARRDKDQSGRMATVVWME